jgi:hypothetical protein
MKDNFDMGKGAVITVELESPDAWIITVRRIGSDADMKISTKLTNWGEIVGLTAKEIIVDIMRLQ